MSEKEIESALKLYDYIVNVVTDENKKLLDFAKEFHKRYLEEKQELPYHINVIDELHINENGHSRILLKLLQFVNERGEWEILQSLVDYIKSRSKSRQFERIDIKRPIITQEAARIDLWVRDKVGNYAIIFENKIYNAQDQEAQLSRYIDKTKECHFNQNDIFVVYLSQTGSEPESQSWSGYQKSFEDRYINLSFSEDILPWLKEDVLPNIKYKDTYLINAIQQYVDYLEGLFDLRTIQKTMNMKLNKSIADFLHFDECKDDKERFEKTREQLHNINELQNNVQGVMDSLGKSIIKQTALTIMNKYPNVKQDVKETEYASLLTNYHGREVLVSIDHYRYYGDKLYCQVEYTSGDPIPDNDELTKLLKEILNENNPKQRWKRFEIDDYIGVADELERVFDMLMT